MKLQNVPLDQIVSNPWRDEDLFPVDKDHVAELRASINEHGFFGGIKGRRRSGKVELGCGHARIAAARKAGLDAVPIYIDDIDDDTMLRLMTDENATQGGTTAAAVLNEVAAVTRRLIEGLLQPGTIVPGCLKAFENKLAAEKAASNLRKGTSVHVAFGHNVIRAYLGQGNPANALRGERAIREAVSALKQSGHFDGIVDDVLRKHPLLANAKPSKSTDVVKIPQPKPRRRVLDERSANVFRNDHQFHAFREAVTTSAAQKAIPVNEQLGLAKEIMRETRDDFSKKHVGAPYIKAKVQARVQDYMKEQRQIDKEERDRYLQEQMEDAIDSELFGANRSLRSLIHSLLKLEKLAEKYPNHPKLGGFSAKLDDLVDSIKQFSRKLK